MNSEMAYFHGKDYHLNAESRCVLFSGRENEGLLFPLCRRIRAFLDTVSPEVEIC